MNFSELILTSGAMKVRNEVRKPTRSFLTMNCLEGFSRNTFSSTSVFRARHSAVSFMLNFLNSYRESL